MHMAKNTPATSSGSTTSLHVCPHCRKAYVTRHGLRQHIQRYHRAVTVDDSDSEVDAAMVEARFNEAAENDDCGTLLLNPEVLQFIGTWCFVCKKEFRQRHLLTRHLRIHHAADWNDTESFALHLSHVHCPDGECFCVPVFLN